LSYPDTPSLSVVVLTFNSADTIAECLGSLANQEYRDFEVLVVDDDSVDQTLQVVSNFTSDLQIRVVRNGSHNIPRGRNIGLLRSKADIVAFLDSDDTAMQSWARVIVDTFTEHRDTACISGDLLPAYRTVAAHAIALNDHAVRRCFGGHAQLSGGNCAINRAAFPDALFDEDFRLAEDLELISRFGNRWLHVPEMNIRHFSRDTLRQYALQTYRYGLLKQYFSFTSGAYQWTDFVPIVILLASIAASLTLWTWWPVLLLPMLSALESCFVIVYERCPPRAAAWIFPAWLVKNFFWTLGMSVGLAALAFNAETRRLLKSKRPARFHLARERARS
jgi:glycosyltransferase involved in cell wall biosynthesis